MERLPEDERSTAAAYLRLGMTLHHAAVRTLPCGTGGEGTFYLLLAVVHPRYLGRTVVLGLGHNTRVRHALDPTPPMCSGLGP